MPPLPAASTGPFFGSYRRSAPAFQLNDGAPPVFLIRQEWLIFFIRDAAQASVLWGRCAGKID